MKSPHPFPFRLLWPVIAVLVGLVLVATTVSVVQALSVTPAAAPGGVHGTLYDPTGTTPIEGGWIDIHDAEGHPWMGTDTAPDGSYSIANLPAGHYVLHAFPPPGSPYADSLPAEVQILNGQWTAQDIDLTQVRISGAAMTIIQTALGTTVVSTRRDPPKSSRASCSV